MRLAPPKDVALKEPKDWKLIGRKLPRLDAVAKTTGRATYSMDVRRPGELIAMVRRPDVFGAKVVSFDDSYAMMVPGVVGVVKIPSGVAVLATDTWSAIGGRDVVTVTWDKSAAELRSTPEIVEDYRRRTAGPGREAARRGDAAGALARASQVVEAEFVFPYLAHAPMEPIAGSIALRSNSAEMWAGSQIQSLDAHFAAKALGFEPEQIKINNLLGGGSFGRRGNPHGDWAAELAEIAKAIGGTAPVRLVWTREDDIKGGYYRPLTLHRVKVGLDASGKLSGWQHRLATQSIFIGTPLEEVMMKDRVDRGSVEGLVDTAYDLPGLPGRNPLCAIAGAGAVVALGGPQPHGPCRRDDARRAGAPRRARTHSLCGASCSPSIRAMLGVLNLAAQKAGWGRPMPKGRGRGIACHRTFGTPVAMVAEVTVARGAYKVDRIVCAVDCGVAVNPDIIEAQVEGSVGFALSIGPAQPDHAQERRGRAVELRRLRPDALLRDAEGGGAHRQVAGGADRHRRAGRAAAGAGDRQRHRRRNGQAALLAALRRQAARLSAAQPRARAGAQARRRGRLIVQDDLGDAAFDQRAAGRGVRHLEAVEADAAHAAGSGRTSTLPTARSSPA